MTSGAKVIGRRLAWSVLGLVAVIVVGFVALIYIGDAGIPFVEGDWVTEHGEAQGFRIGMTRAEAFDVLRTRYRGREASVRFVWERGTGIASRLAPYEAAQSRSWASDRHGFYVEPIDTLVAMPLALEIGDRWDIQLPASWVNDVYVTFHDGRVVKVQRSRWVFERP
jgi:hypothetical protein